MERNTQKNGLVNLAVAVLVLVAAVAAATLVQSLAGFAASAFLLVGALVAFVSWFQMRLEENERNEKLELDELARSRGASLFEAKDSGSFPARNAREQFEKFIVPAFAIALLLLEGVAAWVIWRFSGKDPVTIIAAKATASLSLFLILMVVLFLFGRFAVVVARLEKHRLLQPGASFLLSSAYVCLLVAVGIGVTAFVANHARADFWMARALCVLLGLLAVENLLTLLLEIYRPRLKGRIVRPLYDSRVAGLLAQPESLFTTAAQTLDYQFGFKVSETWIFQALQKNLPAFVLIQLTVLIVSTMFVFVNAGEQVVLEHCGKPAAVFGPGAHLKLPWPIDKAYRFRTDQIQSFAVGYTPDEKNDLPIVLWTVPHAKEENFLVGNRAALQTDTGTNAQPVALVTVSIPVQFQIVNVTNWIYQNAAPDELLQNLATREVVHYLAGSDMNELLSHGRLAAADTLREKIQGAADARVLGVKILFVGLQDIHPPTEKDVAATYEQVVSAEQKTNTAILNAQSAAIATNYAAEAMAFTLTNLADAARIRAQTQAFARAAAFTNQIPAFAAAPSVYRQRQYLQAFAEATKKARKYVLLATNTSDVIILDLEDKVNASFDQLVTTNTP